MGGNVYRNFSIYPLAAEPLPPVFFQAAISTMPWVAPGDDRSIGQERCEGTGGGGDAADGAQLSLDTTAVSWKINAMAS